VCERMRAWVCVRVRESVMVRCVSVPSLCQRSHLPFHTCAPFPPSLPPSLPESSRPHSLHADCKTTPPPPFSPPFSLLPSPSVISQIRLLPDGRHVVSCGVDSLVMVWDAGSGSMVHSLSGHGEAAVNFLGASRGAALGQLAVTGEAEGGCEGEGG
jgi:hypothetical protein